MVVEKGREGRPSHLFNKYAYYVLGSHKILDLKGTLDLLVHCLHYQAEQIEAKKRSNS